MSAVVVTIVLGALGSILAAELLGWCPWLAERLVNAAVCRLAESHRERYRDEWLADMDVMRTRGGVSLLVWAMVLYWVAGRVASALKPVEAKQLKRHRHPTVAEAIRATKQVLKIARLSDKTNISEHLLGNPVVGLILFPGMVFMAWAYTRLDRRFCHAILTLAKFADRQAP